MTNKVCICTSKDHSTCLNKTVYKMTAIEIVNSYLLGIPLKNIAQYAGVSYQSITKVLKNHNIPITKPADRDYEHKNICNDYLSGESIKTLAIKYKKSLSGIFNILKRHSVCIRPKEIKRGKDHPLYKGITYKGLDGYSILPNKKREHRALMEEAVKRPLLHWEHVHHVNGIRTDNSLTNLVIMPAKEHNRFHTFLLHKNLQPSLENLLAFCTKESEHYYRFTKETLEAILQTCPEVAKKYKKSLLGCTIKDCSNFRYGKMLICNKHYQKNRAKARGFWKLNKNKDTK